MATNYETQGAIRGDSTFRSRLAQAVNEAALAISGEAQGGSTTEEWAARQALAHQVLRSKGAAQFEAPVLAYMGSAANMDLTLADQSDITDANFATAIASVWNDVAGIAAS